MKKILKFTLSFIIFVSFVNPVSAQKYPAYTDNYVNDFASVISDTDKEFLGKQLKEFQEGTGVQIVVATINYISDYNTGEQTIEDFAKNLFNSWGVGDKNTNNGILMLVAVKDRKVRIQLGSGYGAPHESQMQSVIDNNILPEFRSEQYSTGIVSGVRGIIITLLQGVTWLDYIKIYLIPILGVLFLILTGVSLIRSGKQGWGWSLIALALLILRNMFKAKSGDGTTGYGGGSSSGRGATGSW